MAFAKQNGNAQSFVTEKDLIRQIASNYTKNQLLRENESKLENNKVQDAKQIMTSNLAKVIRVWSAFTKFIKSQVLEKGKHVDTQTIGLFLSGKGQGKLVYMPLPAFFEAGKFKFPKGSEFNSALDSQQSGKSVKENYSEIYNQRLSEINKQDTTQMSFAALGIVTQVTEENCRKIITDFFSALVELSRRTQKEARIELKGLGFFHLFGNRDFMFQQVDQFSCLTEDELNKHRDDYRDDLSYIADNASAVLSIGGGSTFSVKSSTLSKLSIRTPKSRMSGFSMASTASRDSKTKKRNNSINQTLPPLQKDKLWMRYQNRPDPIRFGQKANPDQLSVDGQNWSTPATPRGASEGQANYHSDAKLSQANTTNSEFPYLQAFIDRQQGKRFSKRVVFDHTHFDNLLGQIVDQNKVKKQENELEKRIRREEENQELLRQKERMDEEAQHEKQDKQLKKAAFVEANNMLMFEKQMANATNEESKLIDRVNYFPFTHGDTIEKQRMVLTDIAKTELQEALKEKSKKTNIEYKQRHDRHLMLNRVANEMMLNHVTQPLEVSVDKEKDHEFELIKNVCNQKSKKHQPFVQKDVDGGLIQVGQQHVMRAAMERHDTKQAVKDDIKAKELQDHNDTIDAHKRKQELERETKERHKAMIFEELQKQMKDKKDRDGKECQDARKFYNTNGGPGMSSDMIDRKNHFEYMRNRETKDYLRHQFESAEASYKIMKEYEQKEDRAEIEADLQVKISEENDKKAQKMNSNQHFRDVWTKQASVHVKDEKQNNYI